MNERPGELIDDLRLLQAPTPLVVLGLGLLGLLLVAAAAWLAWRRVRSRRALAPDGRGAETAHDDALADLERARALMASPNSKPYGIEVSRIVRRYLEVRFGLVAPRRSTEEFLIEAMTSTKLNGEHRSLLGRFLGACDLFKFGRTHGEPEELSELHVTAVGFVTETRIKPEPVRAGEGV